MSTPDDYMPEDQTPEAASSGEPNDLESLRAALAEAQAKAQESRDNQLRAFAELDNVRKRAVRDVEQAHKFALEKFTGELIGVKDTLEMALATGNTGAKELLAGVDATLKLLGKAFEKAGVVELDPQGQPFNPEWHEAMVSQPSDQPPNTVLQVVQKGYQLNGRLLRPARVIVSRPAD